MLDQKIEKAINGQINAELYSAYLYMSMATWFDSIQLPGFAHWMRVQAQEEMTHALRFHNYVNERGGRVILEAIDAPPTGWKSPIDCIQAVAAHEAKVTSLINGLVDLALEVRDHATNNMLQWFVGEQVEEEASAAEIVGKLRLIDKTSGGLFMLDNEAAARVFNMPLDLTI